MNNVVILTETSPPRDMDPGDSVFIGYALTSVRNFFPLPGGTQRGAIPKINFSPGGTQGGAFPKKNLFYPTILIGFLAVIKKIHIFASTNQ